MPADETERKDVESDLEINTLNPPAYNTPVNTNIPKVPGLERGRRMLLEELRQYTSTSPKLSGGDIDAAWEQADAVGEEAVGGTVATPDQSVVDDLGAAVGIEMEDNQPIETAEILHRRDSDRYELDPISSEDYEEHRL